MDKTLPTYQFRTIVRPKYWDSSGERFLGNSLRAKERTGTAEIEKPERSRGCKVGHIVKHTGAGEDEGSLHFAQARGRGILGLLDWHLTCGVHKRKKGLRAADSPAIISVAHPNKHLPGVDIDGWWR